MKKKNTLKRDKKPTKISKKKNMKKASKPVIERSEEEKKTLQIKLNRIIGQLNGVKKMVDDGRESEDLLMQLCASESGILALKFLVYKEVALKSLSNKTDEKLEISLEELLKIMKRY